MHNMLHGKTLGGSPHPPATAQPFIPGTQQKFKNGCFDASGLLGTSIGCGGLLGCDCCLAELSARSNCRLDAVAMSSSCHMSSCHDRKIFNWETFVKSSGKVKITLWNKTLAVWKSKVEVCSSGS